MKRYLASLLYRIYLRLEKSIVYTRMEEHRRRLAACGNNVRFLGRTMIAGHEYISIGDQFVAGDNCRIEAIALPQHAAPSVRIGQQVQAGANLHIGCIEKVEIGDGTLIATNVLIIDHSHGTTDKEQLQMAPADRPLMGRGIVIGKNVWLGDGVCILPGVTLGDGVVVGANAVVTHSFEAGSVIAGVPARLIKSASPQ